MSPQHSPDMSTIEPIAIVDSLQDAADRRVTGVNNKQITEAANAVKLLYAAQNGNSATGFDEDQGETIINQSIHGHSSENITFRDCIAEILSAFAMKLHPLADATFKLWTYGQHDAIDAFIDEGISSMSNISIDGTSSIVNSLTVAYNRKALPISLQELQRDISIPP